eukprot:356133-Chlamydomonas_euryale.AAC.5
MSDRNDRKKKMEWHAPWPKPHARAMYMRSTRANLWPASAAMRSTITVPFLRHTGKRSAHACVRSRVRFFNMENPCTPVHAASQRLKTLHGSHRLWRACPMR